MRKQLGVSSAQELNAATICVEEDTTTKLNVDDYFRAQGIRYEPVVFGSALRDGRGLFQRALRTPIRPMHQGSTPTVLRAPNPDEHAVLPEVISKEPLGAVVREGDAHWANLVRWVHFAMLNAEEHGVNSRECRRSQGE